MQQKEMRNTVTFFKFSLLRPEKLVNQRMARLPSSTTNWPAIWKPKDDFGNSLGFVGEGRVVEMRFHTVMSKGDVTRYIALVVAVQNVHKRAVGKYGDEVIPNFKKDINSPNKVNFDQLCEALGKRSGYPMPKNVLDQNLLNKLHPKVTGHFEFWGEPEQLKNVNLNEEVLFKTNGECMILQSLFVKSYGKFTNMKGGEGELFNQISKLSDEKYNDDEKLPQDQLEGVAEDEWDD
jgi:hypothetical protein